jgi:seryl-tRNA synthetase
MSTGQDELDDMKEQRIALEMALDEAKQERADLVEHLENCKADNEGEERGKDTREALKEAKQALKDFDEEGSIEDAEMELTAFDEASE